MKTRARPRQLPSGGWEMASIRTRRSGAVGYCGDHDEPHATAEEAALCWRKYLLEQTLQLDARWESKTGPCKVCGTETTGTVVINGYPRDHWCPEHATADHVAAWWNGAAG